MIMIKSDSELFCLLFDRGLALIDASHLVFSNTMFTMINTPAHINAPLTPLERPSFWTRNFKRGFLSPLVEINTFIFRLTLSSDLFRGVGHSSGLSKGVQLYEITRELCTFY